MTEVRAISNVLRTMPLFEGHDLESLDHLSQHCTLRDLSPGEVVFAEGAPAAELFILVAGQIRLTCAMVEGPEVVVGYAEAGDMVGEMGIIDPAPRSASARAVEAASVVVLSGDAFMSLVSEGHGIAVDLLRAVRHSLTYRIRVLNERMQALFMLDVAADGDGSSRPTMAERLQGIWLAMRSGG
jgi:CRP-like cAMP-binding protein